MGISEFGKKFSAPGGTSRFSIGSEQQIGWLEGIIKAVIILNLIDAVFTLFWVTAGVGEEANILLQDIINNRPVLFMAVKIALVSLGSLLLWRYRKHPVAAFGIFLAFVVYYLIVLYHLKHSTLLLSIL